MVEGRSPRGDPRNRPQPNSISLGFSFAHLLRTSNQVDSCVQSSEKIKSTRGAVVSKTGPQNFDGSTGSAISPHGLHQIRPSTCQIEAETLIYLMNVSNPHSGAAGPRYEGCTEKMSVSGPIAATLWVLGIRGWALRRLLIYVQSMLRMNFAPGG
jgi:hypothetical protein